MKGPYERLKYVLWRVWECPECQHHERTSGDVTFMYCRCQANNNSKKVCMHLIKDGVRRVKPHHG
jgi:hypothetical protein